MNVLLSSSLLVQLARDLQIDFYPFFKDFFPLLVSLCITQDASIIEVRKKKSINVLIFLHDFRKSSYVWLICLSFYGDICYATLLMSSGKTEPFIK